MTADNVKASWQADGSAMYSLQALWTQARERLKVITVICANQSYAILQVLSNHSCSLVLGDIQQLSLNICNFSVLGLKPL